MTKAISAAQAYQGATSPNPPVGAVAWDSEKKIIGISAHQRAGSPHAEALLIESLRSQGNLDRLHTLFVTLEPCAHYGKTPPCLDLLVKSGVKKVVIGTLDPNPLTSGRGVQGLLQAGIDVETGLLEPECRYLIRSFQKYIIQQRPWITLKTAWRLGENKEWSMIPKPGTKTFTSEDSIVLSHELRKRSDAILTGSGTVLADFPLFTVRKVKDHPHKTRHLVVLGQNQNIPETWIEQVRRNGIELHLGWKLEETFSKLASLGVIEVLVEAGPTLVATLLQKGLWDEHVRIKHYPHHTGYATDSITTELKEDYVHRTH